MEMKNLIWVLFICLASCKSQEPKEIKIMGLEKNLWDKYEYLDRDTNVIFWEIVGDSVMTYTKKDSIRDERERWRFKDSLYKAEELFYNNPGDTTYIR